MKILTSALLFCTLILLLSLSQNTRADHDNQETLAPYQPVYHIPLRIHLGDSNRAPKDWLPILEEINFIWLSQAGICFEMHTVSHNNKITNGLDLWFESTIPDWNGYFTDLHDMHVRDSPDLRPAKHPAGSSAARTAAHELGHALSLGHKQDSDDNLMRSKTYGWQLHDNEITQARTAARQLSFVITNRQQCNPAAIHTEP